MNYSEIKNTCSYSSSNYNALMCAELQLAEDGGLVSSEPRLKLQYTENGGWQ